MLIIEMKSLTAKSYAVQAYVCNRCLRFIPIETKMAQVKEFLTKIIYVISSAVCKMLCPQSSVWGKFSVLLKSVFFLYYVNTCVCLGSFSGY